MENEIFVGWPASQSIDYRDGFSENAFPADEPGSWLVDRGWLEGVFAEDVAYLDKENLYAGEIVDGEYALLEQGAGWVKTWPDYPSESDLKAAMEKYAIF